MSIIFLLIPLSIFFAICFLGAFVWAVRSGQYEDTCTPSMRVLLGQEAESKNCRNDRPEARHTLPDQTTSRGPLDPDGAAPPMNPFNSNERINP